MRGSMRSSRRGWRAEVEEQRRAGRKLIVGCLRERRRRNCYIGDDVGVTLL